MDQFTSMGVCPEGVTALPGVNTPIEEALDHKKVRMLCEAKPGSGIAVGNGPARSSPSRARFVGIA